jgi:cell wall-associated NlpC family hydrolase
MPRSSKNWFIIHSGAAPIYADSTFNSPCISEAVFGESCEIINCKANWLRIECEDGYKGWINDFYGKVQLEKNRPNYVVVFPNETGGFDPKFPFGAKVSENIPGTIQLNDTIGMDQIVPVAKNLLGIPYKWGGKTSLGFDCSGLVQTVLKVCGLAVPRDSYQQRDFFANDEIDLNEAQPGDLHFFGREGKITHVGFSTGGARILHSQGFVKEESLHFHEKNANKNLIDIYMSTHSIRRKFRP